MTFTEIFSAYYRLYRAEASVPASTDDEYTIALSLANEAIHRWQGYDSTKWKELFESNSNDGSGSQTIVTGTSTYDGPDNMQEIGGHVSLKDSSGVTQRIYPIIEPHEAQFKGDNSTYCYFTGDPANGWELHFNPTPDSATNGYSIEYIYYKTPTEFASGTDVTEMSDPYFIVHRMLANRFRASRNPYYSSALNEAEDRLRVMKMTNDSGNWANPWSRPDRSGSIWGG